MAIPDTADLNALLRRSGWFRQQSASVQAALIGGGRVVDLAGGQWLHSEGDAVAGLWSVLWGAVRLEAAVGDRDVLLNIVGPGRIAGQAVGETGRRLVTVRAAERSRLFLVSDAALHIIAAAEPSVWRSVSDLLYAQLEATVRLAADALRLPPKARLAVRLLALSDPETSLCKVSQADLAELTGVSRKAASGHLQRLQQLGVIKLGYRVIRVCNRDRLQALARPV